MRGVPSDRFYGRREAAYVAPVVGSAARQKVVAYVAARGEWRRFPTQQLAFDFVDAHPVKLLQTFAVEYAANGRRYYVAATYLAFWRRYRRMAQQGVERHCYEVIREGSCCKLYFDLEFHTATNPSADGDAMVDFLLEQTSVMLREALPSAQPLAHHSVIELDSSTEHKFSRHVIVPQATFRTNEAAGAFVSELCARCERARPELFMVWDRDGSSTTTFVDQAVYSRNRCFRLLGSTKFGRSARLEFSRRSPLHGAFHEDAFMASLVADVSDTSECLDGRGHKSLQWPGARGAARSAQTPSRPREPSPYPAVDAFVRQIVGDIASWVFFSSTKVITYNVAGSYRYCGRIGRHHRSNRVYMVANLARGELVQRCYDPECRGYQSPPWQLPSLTSALRDEAQGDEISDELLGLIPSDREYYRALMSSARGDPASVVTGGTTGTRTAAEG